MTLQELEVKIKILNAGQRYFVLNDPNGISIYILKYNKKKGLWDYYFEDERGGIHQFRTFQSEEEACDYVYNDAKDAVKIFSDAFARADKEKEERERAKINND